MTQVYLDHAAAEPIKDIVLDNLLERAVLFHNPSSVSRLGRLNRNNIETVRALIAKEINAEPEEIYFTSGASESNALAIRGFLETHENGVVLSTNIEHSSILNNPKVIPDITVNSQGRVTKESLNVANKYWGRPVMYAIQHANNEIGTIQDIELLRPTAAGGVLFVDAAQTFGKLKIDVKKMHIDMLSASGGKIGGLRGTGFLYIRNGLNIAPQIFGTQENGMRGGTYFDLGIWAMGLVIASSNYQKTATVVRSLRNYLIDRLNKIDGVSLIGPVVGRLPNNVFIKISDLLIDSQQLVSMLEEEGFVVSAGSACHEGSGELSHVLKAVGETENTARTAIRITLGEENTKEEIDSFVDSLATIIDMWR